MSEPAIDLSPDRGNGRPTLWGKEERETVREAARKLKEKGVVSDVFVIPQHLVQLYGENDATAVRERIRLAAARHQSDAVLIVRGVSDVDSYVNPLSLLYGKIVGLWIVPGTHQESLFLVDATLWDVRNDFLYANFTAEGEGSTVRPEIYSDAADAVAIARRAAITSLADEIDSLALENEATAGVSKSAKVNANR